MHDLLPIGRFSRLCRLTVKALRHYDEVGLLRPALVDERSGYRYYALAQAADAERIRLLRDANVPLEEVRSFLAAPDAAAARSVLEAHRRRLEAEAAGIQGAVAALGRLLDGEEPGAEIEVRRFEARSIVSVRATLPADRIAEEAGRAFGEILAYLSSVDVRPTGQPFSVYHDEEYREELDVEFAVPAARRLAGKGRLDGRALDEAVCACTVLAGPYERVGLAYRDLTEWMRGRGHESAGAPRETYLVGPCQAADAREYRTEIAWPIR